MKRVSPFLITVFGALALIAWGLPPRKSNTSDFLLESQFQHYNDAYFEGALPRDAKVGWADIPKDKTGSVVLGRTLNQDIGAHQYTIEIDRASNVTMAEAELTLLHEMCHVDNDEKGVGQLNIHGPEFQGCMKRLAAENAFEGLW